MQASQQGFAYRPDPSMQEPSTHEPDPVPTQSTQPDHDSSMLDESILSPDQTPKVHTRDCSTNSTGSVFIYPQAPQPYQGYDNENWNQAQNYDYNYGGGSYQRSLFHHFQKHNQNTNRYDYNGSGGRRRGDNRKYRQAYHASDHRVNQNRCHNNYNNYWQGRHQNSRQNYDHNPNNNYQLVRKAVPSDDEETPDQSAKVQQQLSSQPTNQPAKEFEQVPFTQSGPDTNDKPTNSQASFQLTHQRAPPLAQSNTLKIMQQECQTLPHLGQRERGEPERPEIGSPRQSYQPQLATLSGRNCAEGQQDPHQKAEQDQDQDVDKGLNSEFPEEVEDNRQVPQTEVPVPIPRQLITNCQTNLEYDIIDPRFRQSMLVEPIPQFGRKQRNYNQKDLNKNMEITDKLEKQRNEKKQYGSNCIKDQILKSAGTKKAGKHEPGQPDSKKEHYGQNSKISKERIGHEFLQRKTMKSLGIEDKKQQVEAMQLNRTQKIQQQASHSEQSSIDLKQISFPGSQTKLQVIVPKFEDIYFELNAQDISEIIIHSFLLNGNKIKTKGFQNTQTLKIFERKHKLPSSGNKFNIKEWLFCRVEAQSQFKLRKVTAMCQRCKKREQGEINILNIFTKKCACDKILHFELKVNRTAVPDEEKLPL